MILKFPDLETLKLVLINGAVPPSVSLAPASAGFDDQGQLWLEPSVTPARKAQEDLKQHGVQIGKKSGTELSGEVSCWLEMLPLVRDRQVVAPPEQTPVLFDLSSGEQFTRMATEILRLGNDRQGYRWLEEKDGTTRALLRVVGPPYYSLLRALDGVGPTAPRAFVERATGVWVQLGWSHPLAERIKPPKGQILLLRPPRLWTYLPEESFRDIYEVLEFQLPGSAINYKDSELKDRLKVSLRLSRGGTDVAELWVLRNDPVAELNKLVQNSDDKLLDRLAFAVGESKGKKTIVLKVRRSKEPPPVVVLDAVGFRPFLKMENLFLPCGRGLHPPLRRDIVREKLAGDPNVLTWLYPEDKEGRFTPESISQDVFRPLKDWVDYVIDLERESLSNWIQSNSFDFESFVCDEDGPPKPRKPPVEKGRGQGGKGSGGTGHDIDLSTPKDQGKDDKDVKALAVDDLISLVPQEPTAQQIRLRELEDHFTGFEGPLDVRERQAMWPEMASLNMALKHHDDAGTCWLNALWHSDDWPEGWLWAWFHNEAGSVPERAEKGRKPSRWTASVLNSPGRPRELPGEDLDRVLNLVPANVNLGDVRALAAYVVWASRRTPVPAELSKRLNSVGRFLEAHEGLLAVRASWLAWLAFSQLTGGDVLALARARDRLLERLFQNGLRPEQDLPSFLRFAGQSATQRFRGIREWMLELCNRARDWSREANQGTQQTEGAAPTLAYIQLYFAYGLARLNEAAASRDLFEQARKVLEKAEDAHKFLLAAFAHRIKQAQAGHKNAGPLPAEQMEHLQKKMDRLQHYAVDRLRQHSRILEPDEKIDPYADWAARTDELATKLADTARLTDKKEIADRLLKLFREAPKGNKGHDTRAKVLRTGLDVAPRVSEEFALEILTAFGPAWDAMPDPNEIKGLIERAELLERGLFVSGHFGRKDHVQGLVARFQKLLQSQRGSGQAMQAIERLANESLRGLRKLGMRDEIDVLLKQMADVILEGKDPSSLSTGGPDSKHGPAALRALLHVASGWLYFGRERQAEPIINAARTLLLHGDWQVSQARERALLAGVYARTVGGAPVEVVKTRLGELFRELHNIRDTMTTNKYYSLFQLDIVESVVLAIAGEDQTLGANARRWLDDDEFIVRRRVHRDFHEARD